MLREYGGILDEVSQALDLCLLGLGFYLTVILYSLKQVLTGRLLEQYFLIFLVYILCWVISSRVYRVYQSRRFMSAVRESAQLIKSHLLSSVVTIASVTVYEPTLIHNRFLFYFGFAAICLTLGTHLLVRMILQAGRSMGKNTRYVLILGSGEAASTYLDKVKDNPQLGYKVVGYLAPEKNGLEIPYLGDYANLETVLGEQIVDITVITAPLSDDSVKNCVELLDTMGKAIAVLLNDTVAKVARSRPLDFGGLSMVAYDGRLRQPGHELAKRVMDVVLTGIGLIVLSPILIAIAIAVKVSSQGPVVFAQERVGLNGRTFKMYKFRSMVVNAEELKSKLAHLNEMSGPVFKIKDDPRVTAVGSFLRKTSLDELPQLLNVFIGDMSLVGPRPPLPSEVNLYDPKHRKRLAVRPGITCIWQISGRNDVDFEEWMAMDAEYVERWSLWMDLGILLKTVPVVLMKKGAS
jgi:exopolysaccharide biosynthesis polyprenyl glycosylphosphotransferase